MGEMHSSITAHTQVVSMGEGFQQQQQASLTVMLTVGHWNQLEIFAASYLLQLNSSTKLSGIWYSIA